MPEFSYKAKSRLKGCIEGVVDAEDIDSAARKIIQSGAAPVEIKARTAAGSFLSFHGGISIAEKARFFRQLSDLTDAEVPLLKSIYLSLKSTRGKFRLALEKVCAEVTDGKSLSEAMRGFPGIFAGMHINMIHSGEISGRLGLALKRVAGFMEDEHEARRKLGLSLVYPAFILFFSCVVILVLLTFVIPKILVMYEDMSQSLPLATVILMKISNSLRQYWWVVASGLFLTFSVLAKARSTRAGRLRLDRLLLTLPVNGPVMRAVEIGTFCRVLASLLEAGISIVSALDSARGIMRNEALKEEVSLVIEDVTHGTSLTEALKARSMNWSETDINMIVPGEASGRLVASFYKLADHYDEFVETRLKTVTALMEPAIILIVGLIVGFILIAALLPILNINMIVR